MALGWHYMPMPTGGYIHLISSHHELRKCLCDPPSVLSASGQWSDTVADLALLASAAVSRALVIR